MVSDGFWWIMANQNKMFSFEIKRQTKQNVFPSNVERTVDL